ncbi:MAG: PLP-dependent aspartate aminotransferase family protein [Bacteroidales bacterium]|nr:PLP-dependent aspartate aminotransferase family protein [Bacteroidales bacterium]
MKKTINSTRMPVYRDAGFELNDSGITLDAFRNESDNEHIPANFIYSRYRNPSVIDAEETLMEVEGSKWALLTQSGMAAIDTAVSVFQHADDRRPWLFTSEIYGGTNSYVDSVLKSRRGINIHRFSPEGMCYDMENFEREVKEVKPSLVFFEVVSNPMLVVAPLKEMLDIIHRYDAVAIIDNTFASPHLLKPLEMGADIVIHSATKYLGGHGNITAGALCGNDKEIMKKAIEYRKLVGHMLSPDDAYRLKTQMQSFRLRFSRQCSNAASLASELEKSELVEKVYYPGLKRHVTHNIAEQLFGTRGYGAIVTFSFAGSDNKQKRQRRDAFISGVSDYIKLVPTLGDSHTILMPVEPIWGDRYPDPGMIRISLGFEDTEELLSKLRASLDQIGV